MAIVKKTREFSKIMEDVEVLTIPVKFIKRLTIFLEDDTDIEFDNSDLENLDSLETLLYKASFSDKIRDMRVELDFSTIEKTITKQVKILLDEKDND
jgi:hypothetical protein